MKKAFFIIFALILFLSPGACLAAAEFNPNSIISDEEMQRHTDWTKNDVQNFLQSKESFLSDYQAEDWLGETKPAADIIYEAAQNYRVNPKFLLVTLQKEQSLVTDDQPTQRQLDWATGYAVCDGCYLSDPKVVKYKGFGKQVDGAAGIIRWYYDNTDNGVVKKSGQLINIDGEQVVPQSWATAFLYTYTPHLHGNKNFWNIWQTWFNQIYPNGTLVRTASTSEYFLITDGKKRKIKSQSILMSRADPEMAVVMPEIDLGNYPDGPDISFPNYSILKTPSRTYLLDGDSIRPFASDSVVAALGYNPQELIEANEADLAGFKIGPMIYASSTAPQGEIYKISDLKNALYLFKDGVLYPLAHPAVAQANFKNLIIQTKKLKDIANLPIADEPIKFADGALLKVRNSNKIFVMENGKKRRVADMETFEAMGYKTENLVLIDLVTALNLPDGDPLYVNNSLASAKNKFLGDSEATVDNLFKTTLPAYLVAEYPSGRILAGKNIDTPRPIASLTKMLTAFEALEQDLDLKATTAYDKKLQLSESNAARLRDGEKIKNSDLLRLALTASYNSAARLLARAIGLTETDLIANINERLERWGADNTEITDLSGWSEKNVSSPRDLLKIFVKTTGQPEIKDALIEIKYSFKGTVGKSAAVSHQIQNTNSLVFNPNKTYFIRATKTGYTDEAKAVLVMLIESKKTKKQYVIVTMGNENYAKRFDEPHRLANWVIAGKAEIAKK